MESGGISLCWSAMGKNITFARKRDISRNSEMRTAVTTTLGCQGYASLLDAEALHRVDNFFIEFRREPTFPGYQQRIRGRAGVKGVRPSRRHFAVRCLDPGLPASAYHSSHPGIVRFRFPKPTSLLAFTLASPPHELLTRFHRSCTDPPWPVPPCKCEDHCGRRNITGTTSG